MQKLDLNHLIDLEALLSEGSVAGAARKLHISAPAMSRRLAHLRDALGDPLFVLAGRRLVPTERAQALRERVQTVIEDVRGILAPPAVDFATLERTLSLRANDGFAGIWAARLLARIRTDAPNIRLRFKPRADKKMEALRSGEVDFDLGVLDTPAPEIKSQTLLRVPFVGVVRADHPILKKRRIDAGQFVRWPHVSASRRGFARGPIDGALESLGLSRQVAAVAPGFQAALSMAAHSDMIAAMPAPFANWGAENGLLRTFALPVTTPAVEIALSWHPRMHADPVHAWLRDQIRAVTKDVWKP